MKNSELFDLVVTKVSEVCEIPADAVFLGAKLQAFVDARILAFQYMRRNGLSNDDIAIILLRRASGNPDYFPEVHEIKQKAKSVDRTFKCYSERCLQDKSFRAHSYDLSVILDAALSDEKLREYAREKWQVHD